MESSAKEGFSIMVVQHELTHCWIVNGKKFFTEEEALDYKKNFKERNTRNIAEEKCVEFLKEKNILYTRYGFDALFDIPWQKFNMIPEVLRNTPDYMTFYRQATLLEAKGCNDILRIKESDMKSYDWWYKICPLTVFVYSTAHQEHKLIKWNILRFIAMWLNDTDVYPDNKKLYYKIPWDEIDSFKEVK